MFFPAALMWWAGRRQREQAARFTPLEQLQTEGMFDYIIVGGGSAGCACFHALVTKLQASGSSATVLLLEAGPDDSSDANIQVPLACGDVQLSGVDYKFRTEPQTEACLGLANKVSHWPRARVLGGCSSMNYMCYIRGDSSDFESWESVHGLPGWGWSAVQPYFAAIEQLLRVHILSAPNVQSLAFVTAAQQAGYAAGNFLAQLTGVSLIHTNTHCGKRVSANKAFVQPLLGPNYPHARVAVNVTTARVVVRGGRAVGVLVRPTFAPACADAALTLLRARREVIVAAGAVGSPQLLMLSGLGPALHLRALGLPVVADLPRVGKNLQDHVTPWLRMSAVIPCSLTRHKAESLPSVARYLVTGDGLPNTSGYEAFAFFASGRSSVVKPGAADLQLNFCCGLPDRRYTEECSGIALTGPWTNTNFHPQEEGMSLMPTILRPKSAGEITLRSAAIRDHPVIDPRYLAEKEDVDVLVAGIHEMLRISNTPPLSAHADKLQLPAALLADHDGVTSDAFWRDYVRHYSITLYHPCGTCAMGMDALTGVVDATLAVHGIQGLRVADCSVFPHITSANTNAPAMMVGFKLGSELAAAAAMTEQQTA